MRIRYSVRIDSNFDFPSVYTPHNAYNVYIRMAYNFNKMIKS